MRKILSASLFSLLLAAGCGTGGKVTISDSITPAGPLYLDIGQSVTFTSAVKNDPANRGVTFQLHQTSITAQSQGSLVQTDAFTATYTTPAAFNVGVVTASVLAVPVANTLAGASVAIFLATPPSITTTSLAAATVNVAYSQMIAASGGTAPTVFSITSGTLPAGLTLSTTGTLSGTPTTPGTYTFTVGATDSASTPVTATATYTIVVSPALLTINTGNLPTAVATQSYSTTITSTGGTGAVTFSLYSGTLPAGVTLAPSGVLSGTPAAAGSYTFTVQATDSGTPTPQTARKTFTLAVNGLLTITTTSLPNGSVKNAYSAQLTSTGGNGVTSYTLASGTLPGGLMLSATGLISGTPTTTGASTFTVQAGDTSSPQQTATATLSITIVLSTLAITTTSLPQVTVNNTYSQQLTSTGGNPPVTWALATGSGPLPPGLTLSATGLISGTVNTVGNYSFNVQATDTTPAFVTKTLSINVVALTGLQVTTTTLPNGNIGAAYSTTLAASGGVNPYTWTIAVGALPPGLTLSTAGVLSGIPYIAGTSTFTVQVKDSQATPATATKQLTLTIGTTLAAGPNNGNLSGSYAFLLNGFNTGNTSGKVYGFAAIGSLSFNAAGAVTGTEDTNTPTGAQQSVAVTGTYTLGSDNRGFMILTAGGVSTTYTIVASTVQFGLAQSIALSEFDNSTGTGANTTGFARRQTATAFTAATLNGSFTFGMQGESPCSSCATPAPKFGPVAVAGFFTANGTTTITTGTEDAAAYGSNYASVTIAGTFTAPSTTTGRGTLVLTPGGTIFSAPPATYTYVIVSAGELLLMSDDSHATTTLLYGDALLQANAPYSTASFTGRSIGYESQAAGGDGTVTFPPSLNAILSVLTNTAAGTASLLQDANRAGTFTAGTAAAVTYTVANGRAVINSTPNQVVYLSGTGAGFGLDLASTTGYPALLQYELQANTSAILPLLLTGTLSQRTLANPVPATTVTGYGAFTLFSGGVNVGAVGGQIVLTTDSDSPAGVVGYGVASTEQYVEDLTGHAPLTQGTTGTTSAGVLDAITTTRAVSIPGTSTVTTPTVTVFQQ